MFSHWFVAIDVERVIFLMHNEQTKLTANWLNTLATALVAAGVFAPAAAVLYGLSSIQLGRGFLSVILLGCVTLGWPYILLR